MRSLVSVAPTHGGRGEGRRAIRPRRALFSVLPLLVLAATAADCRAETVERVRLATPLGEIEAELYPERAPATVANFLRYVDAGMYDGASFYRAVRLDNQPQSPVKIEVIQGGRGFGAYDADVAPPFAPVAHETTAATGLRHVDGALSMARLQPGSATSEFFICIGAQPELDFGGARNPDGQGFAVFGRVVAGMDVVRAIQARPTGGIAPEHMGTIAGQVLSEAVAVRLSRR